MSATDEPLVTLRPVLPSDWDALFRFMADPESVRMAAFTPDDPDDRDRFDAHMTTLMVSPDVTVRVIVWNDEVVGSIGSWAVDGETELTYWIDRAVWNRGIATRALGLYLDLVTARPLRARAASDNVGSLRVLAKNGFRVVGTEVAYASARGGEIEETVLRLP